MDAALAYRETDTARPRAHARRRPAWTSSSTHTSTASNVEMPPSSAAASTDEVGSQCPAIWLQPVVDRLNRLLQLQDGWDGPGTLGIDIEVAERALKTLEGIATEKTRPPSISPGPDGSLQLAWYDREFELEIEVPRSGNMAVSLYKHSSDQELELTLTSPELSAAIKDLIAD